MDPDEELLLEKPRSRAWLVVLIALPFLGLVATGVAFFLKAQDADRDEVLVDRITGAAFGCVASVRGDAPETWGLDRALEHMSRMERVTRDTEDPGTEAERARFASLAADAAAGCEQLGRLMLDARREAPHLYFAVPAALAQPPDQSRPELWYRRVLPESRAEVLDLTRQIRTMADAINALRAERSLMVQELPIDGRGASELARIITLADLPRDREEIRGEAWPLADFVLVLRRGSIGRVPCETRYLNRASCYGEFVQTVSWDGEPGPLRALERPARVTYWASFSAAPNGDLYAVGIDTRNRGIVGRYPPDAIEPELAAIDATIDGAASVIAVGGGVAVFPADGSAWLAEDGSLAFTRVETTPAPVVLSASSAEAGITLDGYGQLSLFGTQEAGWTSRLSPSEGDDILLRILDAHSRVDAIVALRALRSGKAVALLQRGGEPDAVLLTTQFGRAWLTEPSPDA